MTETNLGNTIPQNARPPRVYVTNFADKNFEGANEYGEIIYLTQGFVSFKDLNKVRRRLREQLKTIQPYDYVILSGANLLCALVMMTWLKIIPSANVLQYDPRSDSFQVIQVTRE